MSAAQAICALCGTLTQPDAPCGACGHNPLLLGRFTLRERVALDARGERWAATDESGQPVFARATPGPLAPAEMEAWEAAARAWQRLTTPVIAPPVAWGTLPDGRHVRVEQAMEGVPLRQGGSRTSALAIVERILDALAAVHAGRVAHGALDANTLLRRADGRVLLVDFSPSPADPADDVAAVGRMAPSFSRDPFMGRMSRVFEQMQTDPQRRLSAAQARDALHEMRMSQSEIAVALPEPPRVGGTISPRLLVALILAIGGYAWSQLRSGSDVWEGTLTGHVSATTGPAPVKRLAACEVVVSRAKEGAHNCRIVVTCRDKVIYGRGDYGLAKCVGAPPRAADPDNSQIDGDPQLELSADRGIVQVTDERYSEWSVSIRLTDE